MVRSVNLHLVVVTVTSKIHAIDVDVSEAVVKEIKNLQSFIATNQFN